VLLLWVRVKNKVSRTHTKRPQACPPRRPDTQARKVKHISDSLQSRKYQAQHPLSTLATAIQRAFVHSESPIPGYSCTTNTQTCSLDESIGAVDGSDMCVCLCMCACVHMRVLACTRAHAVLCPSCGLREFACTYTYECTYTCACVRVCVCACVRAHILTQTARTTHTYTAHLDTTHAPHAHAQDMHV
jgi:hypothetical protein